MIWGLSYELLSSLWQKTYDEPWQQLNSKSIKTLGKIQSPLTYRPNLTLFITLQWQKVCSWYDVHKYVKQAYTLESLVHLLIHNFDLLCINSIWATRTYIYSIDDRSSELEHCTNCDYSLSQVFASRNAISFLDEFTSN